MIRIEYLKLRHHPQLGDIELFFSPPSESKKSERPYTSIIIGPNGTGKSFILRTIAEILRQFNSFLLADKRDFSLPYGIHLRYQMDNNIYEIVSSNYLIFGKNGTRRNFIYLKNRPFDFELLSEISSYNQITRYEILPKDLEFPNKLLVNSLMLTDRFVFQESKSNDFYQYLGVRSSSGSSSTRASSRRTIRHLFSATDFIVDFNKNLKELLFFLEFEPSLEINYSTKINKLFFSGNLTIADFKKYFEYWWDENFKYSSRKQENPLWSIPYYNRNFKENPSKVISIVDYLNKLTISGRLIHKKNASSKLLSIDLLDVNLSKDEMGLINELENLDILNLDGIKLKKKDSKLSIADLSSGEYHLIISLIGIFSNITENSVVLIDEPEISLHPNWQMRYITFLKKVFSKFPSCHFIITTHSHFLVSDLEGESSSITALSRNANNDQLKAELLENNTFGWSAEEVLYSVFGVKSTRNFFIEYDLVKLVSLLNRNSDDYVEIRRIVNKLYQLPLSENDPLKIIIEKSNKYLKLNNA